MTKDINWELGGLCFCFFLSLLLSAAGRSVFPLFLIHPPRCNKNGWWRRVNQQHRKPPLFNSLKAKLRTVLTHSSCWQYWFLHVKKKTTPKQFFFFKPINILKKLYRHFLRIRSQIMKAAVQKSINGVKGSSHTRRSRFSPGKVFSSRCWKSES